MNTLSRGNNSVKRFCPLLNMGFIPKGNVLLPLGPFCFLFRVDPFSEGDWCVGEQRNSHKKCLLYEKWRNIYEIWRNIYNARTLRTTQALISLRIRTGWSGPSLSAYRINRYCSICRRTENVQTRLHGCARSSGHSLFAYDIRKRWRFRSVSIFCFPFRKHFLYKLYRLLKLTCSISEHWIW